MLYSIQKYEWVRVWVWVSRTTSFNFNSSHINQNEIKFVYSFSLSLSPSLVWPCPKRFSCNSSLVIHSNIYFSLHIWFIFKNIDLQYDVYNFFFSFHFFVLNHFSLHSILFAWIQREFRRKKNTANNIHIHAIPKVYDYYYYCKRRKKKRSSKMVFMELECNVMCSLI